MHEMSIVEALLDVIRQEQRVHPRARVRAVRIRVGALRQMVPDIMKFCFHAAAQGTNLADVTLEIEEVPARAHCPQCQHDFRVAENWFQCPRCQSVGGEVLAGQELDLTGIECEEACVV